MTEQEARAVLAQAVIDVEYALGACSADVQGVPESAPIMSLLNYLLDRGWTATIGGPDGIHLEWTPGLGVAVVPFAKMRDLDRVVFGPQCAMDYALHAVNTMVETGYVIRDFDRYQCSVEHREADRYWVATPVILNFESDLGQDSTDSAANSH